MGSHIRYIVLTDVHLGAGNSILTQVQPGKTVADTHYPSPALLSLADCLRSLVSGCNGSGRPPTLIAAGDLIDLALSAAERALPVFGMFAEALMAGDEPVIDDEVILLPGNHDHLTWDYARQRWLEDRLVAAGGRLDGAPSHRIGPMLLDREPAIVSVPLTALVRGSTGRAGASVRVLYPDLALPSADGRRLVSVLLLTWSHSGYRFALALPSERTEAIRCSASRIRIGRARRACSPRRSSRRNCAPCFLTQSRGRSRPNGRISKSRAICGRC